jgi:hypothetical protein
MEGNIAKEMQRIVVNGKNSGHVKDEFDVAEYWGEFYVEAMCQLN